jgi:N-methylhydantoinase A
VPYRLGIDIGGTFTDLVLLGDGAPPVVRKVLSTPDDFARGVLEGVRALLAAGPPAAGVQDVVHGTTVATNALLERRGAPTGLLTTAGFRDLLEIRRLRLPRLYDLGWEKPPPLVERALRLEVDERLDHSGAVVRPLDEASARAAIERLRAAGVTAVAICLLHAYADATHEARLGALVQALLPGVFVSLSHQVLPQIQEYERLSTTVINAYVGPVVAYYLEQMAAGLAGVGVTAPLRVMQSNGASMDLPAARRRPAHLIESGPAAGVVAVAALGRQTGERRLLALDMGGTTAKAALVLDGAVPLAAEAEIGAGVTAATRLNRGGGYALSLPAVDLVEVGAGGGSLLWLDAGGALQVGPESAGAAPGPACYGRGGTAPTLTDANVVLGYLNPIALAGGAVPLDAAAAAAAVGALGARLGLPPEEAAYGAFRVAVASMVRAVRAVSAERGHDPAGLALVAFGGNGPLHGAAVAAALGIPRVIVPPAPGVFSAWGLLAAEVAHHASRTYLRSLEAVDVTALQGIAGGLRDEALASLGAAGDVVLEWSADLRYTGQSSELNVPLTVPPDALPGTESLAGLAGRFATAHERRYGHRAPGEPVELVHLRLVARVPGEAPPLPGGARDGAPGRPGPPSGRRVYFGPRPGWHSTPVVARTALARSGDVARPAGEDGDPHGGEDGATGPLIVEDYDATTLVPPGWRVRLDRQGAIVLEAPR